MFIFLENFVAINSIIFSRYRKESRVIVSNYPVKRRIFTESTGFHIVLIVVSTHVVLTYEGNHLRFPERIFI